MDVAKTGAVGFDPDSALQGGNFHLVAARGAAGDWRTHAALGMCGRTGPALEQLSAFDDPDARFYEGVIRWIDGDESAAVRLLEPLDSEHADNLLRLIRKPKISILSQLSWHRSTSGPHNMLIGGERDPKFQIRNISFAPDDLPNRPDADIHDYYDSASPPDLYLSEMIEWHVIPPNLQELPCPIIGQTGDYDLHIQTLLPWLRLFDELLVTDMTEYADVRGLVDAPVTTYCKPVSLPPAMPAPIECEKDLDMVVTGTLLHSYYPDKAEMMRQILGAADFEPFFYNGFFPATVYYPTLARSKLAVALPRHLGAIPSRGYEALAMGTVLLAPHESCQRLFTGDGDGLVPFSLDKDGLRRSIESVMADFERHQEGALRGMDIIRREFEPWRVASQYLRMAVFLAARPRPVREPAPSRPVQMRSVSYKGFLQAGGETTYRTMRDHSLNAWKRIPDDEHTLASISLPAREMLLEYEFRTLMPPKESLAPLIQASLKLYGSAVERFPRSLALRFNFIRAAFHFGSEEEIRQALDLARGTLDAAPAVLTLDPMDDVVTWDFCQNFFNYRRYLQIVTEAKRDKTNRTGELKNLILASLHFYYARMTGDDSHTVLAAELDPEFPIYRLATAQALDRQGDEESARDAIALLETVIGQVTYAPEAWYLLLAIGRQHGIDIPNEDRHRQLVERMERRTLIDETYLAIRNGPYFRAQRLNFARNTGLDIRKDGSRTEPVEISVLLADTNGARYPELVDSLSRQTLDRKSFEVICCDVFERDTPHMMAFADTVMVMGQNEYLYNRNTAFNAALLRANGRIVVFFNRDTVLSRDALQGLADAIRKPQEPPVVVVNPGGETGSQSATHIVALSREDALRAGGLDESAYHAGWYSGPYELVVRMVASGCEPCRVNVLPAAENKETMPARQSLAFLLHEVWPEKFTQDRTAPLRENPALASLRRQLDK